MDFFSLLLDLFPSFVFITRPNFIFFNIFLLDPVNLFSKLLQNIQHNPMRTHMLRDSNRYPKPETRHGFLLFRVSKWSVSLSMDLLVGKNVTPNRSVDMDLEL